MHCAGHDAKSEGKGLKERGGGRTGDRKERGGGRRGGVGRA